MKRDLRARIAIAAATAAAILPSQALAQQVRPLADLRLRHEFVDQDGSGKRAAALTARARTGAELRTGKWSLLAEGEWTLAPVERYFSGVNDKSGFPLVADPGNVELNRLQLQHRPANGTTVTAGRQRLAIGDQRFIGNSGWRQNEQTFDAIRVESALAGNLRADIAYAWSVRTIWGIDGSGARPQSVSGDNLFATLAWTGKAVTVNGFAYLVGQDEAAVNNHQLSSKTFGARLAGERKITPAAILAYSLSLARQSDWNRNPNRYSAGYALADLALKLGDVSLGVGFERLGADRGLPFTSFQTPLAALHKFQGWADKFTVTPPDGIDDFQVSAGYGRKALLGFDKVDAALVHHRFHSARGDQHYGGEWDLLLSARRGRWTATAKLAVFDSDGFATDTRKAWLQLEWAY